MQGQAAAESPEPLALQWAARNPWFGTDSEMTYYAYEVHDQLIEQEGLDPNSAEYYEQIGLRVEQRFPERYASGPLLDFVSYAYTDCVSLMHIGSVYCKLVHE